MSNKNLPSNTISSYRKRQQSGPMIIWGLAAVLILVGIVLLVFWLTGPNKPNITLFATQTPTPTLTPTPTNTPFPTATPTVTETPTETPTPTPSAPFSYKVQEGESVATIAEKFNLGEDGILLILALNPAVAGRGGIVFVGEDIIIPNPDAKLPTATPIPPDLRRGTLLKYTVIPGDSLDAIALKFNSTTDAIIDENDIENPNALNVGQVLNIPVNLVTPIPTTPPAPTATPQARPVTATCAVTTNADYIAQMQTLINKARTDAGLRSLTRNTRLDTAATIHSNDMACNSIVGHFGSDGKSFNDRISAQGYSFSASAENFFTGPGDITQKAIDWWLLNPTFKDAMLNPNFTEFGIGYASFNASMHSGYFTVVFARP